MPSLHFYLMLYLKSLLLFFTSSIRLLRFFFLVSFLLFSTWFPSLHPSLHHSLHPFLHPSFPSSISPSLPPSLHTARVSDVIMCMPHRGRLNLLTGQLQVSPTHMFHKVYFTFFLFFSCNGCFCCQLCLSPPLFADQRKPRVCSRISKHWWCSLSHGSVSMHLMERNICHSVPSSCAVASVDLFAEGDYKLHVTMLPNPSHLEAVNPVAMGKARARMLSLGVGPYSPCRDQKSGVSQSVATIPSH